MARRGWRTSRSPTASSTRRSPSFFSDEQQAGIIIERMQGENGDLLVYVADNWKVSCAALAALRNHLGKDLELYDPSEICAAWIVDFPLVTWNDELNRWDAEHHMFCSVHPDDVELLQSDPGKVRAQSYDLVCNGYEAASGSIRIHDPSISTADLRSAQHRSGGSGAAVRLSAGGAPLRRPAARRQSRWGWTGGS